MHHGRGRKSTNPRRCYKRLRLQAFRQSHARAKADLAGQANSLPVPEIQQDFHKVLALLSSIEHLRLTGMEIALSIFQSIISKPSEVHDALI
jgi:hypothetical protein